jgi:hypothetical protein
MWQTGGRHDFVGMDHNFHANTLGMFAYIYEFYD